MTEIFTKDDVLLTLRCLDANNDKVLLTVTLEYSKAAVNDAGAEEKLDAFRNKTLASLNDNPNLAPDQETAVFFPIIRRGEEVSSYYKTLDGRIIEYDIQQRVYNKRSQYQHIQIKETIDYGNVLFLDYAVQLGESDSEGLHPSFHESSRGSWWLQEC